MPQIQKQLGLLFRGLSPPRSLRGSSLRQAFSVCFGGRGKGRLKERGSGPNEPYCGGLKRSLPILCCAVFLIWPYCSCSLKYLKTFVRKVFAPRCKFRLSGPTPNRRRAHGPLPLLLGEDAQSSSGAPYGSSVWTSWKVY